MGVVRVRRNDGNIVEHEAAEGWSLMEILRDSGEPVEGICMGQCDCASCHVYVDKMWYNKLPSMREDERLTLDELPSVLENSRLSCQIIWDDCMDGMEVEVALG